MGSRHSKPSSPPKQLKTSKSKPKSKSKTSHKTKISRPFSKAQLDYPSLPSPTFRRLTHTPKKTNPTPEEALHERVERYRYETKKAPLPPVSRPPTRRAVVRPAPAPAKVAAQRKESQYQFKPLNEIGRPTSSKRATPDPKTLPQQAVRVQLTRQAGAKPYEIRPKVSATKGKTTGYGLYPPKQKGDVRGGSGSEYSFILILTLLFITHP